MSPLLTSPKGRTGGTTSFLKLKKIKFKRFPSFGGDERGFYRATRPEASPPISFSTSSTVTWL